MYSRNKLAVFSVALIFLTSFTSAAMISNSNDWRDNAFALSYNQFTDENIHIVTNLGEGQIIADMVSDSGPHTVYESENPVWDNYGNFLGTKGVDNVETQSLNWEEDQYDFYSRVNNEVEGFVVVKPGYGMDTISVFPKVVKSDRWLLYYQGQETVDFLKKQDKPVLFYGEYLSQPWKKLDSQTKVIDTGSKSMNNKKLVGNLYQDYKSQTAIVAGEYYFEKGFMSKGDPIVISQDLAPTVRLMEEHNVSVVEVIGAENVGFGNSLKDQLGDAVTVIAKFGRKFTGAEGLDSTYPIKKIPVEPVERSVTLNSVSVSDQGNSSEVDLQFINNGTIATALNFSAVQFTSGQQTELVSRPVDIVLRPGRNTSIELEANLSFEPESAEVSYTYESQSGLSTENYQVSRASSTGDSVELLEVYYSKPEEEIVLTVENNGQEPVWVGAQIENLETLNRTVTALTEEVNKVEAGETGQVSVNAYLTENQTADNRELNVTLTYGDSKTVSTGYTRVEDVRMNVREMSMTAAFFQSAGPAVVVLVILLLVVGWAYRAGKISSQLERLRG